MATYLSKILLWVCLVLFALPASVVKADLINGGFDSPGGDQPAQGLGVNSTFITGWLTVPGYEGTFTGAVEYFHDRSQDPGGYSVELGFYDGSTGLQQTFSTSLNQVYFVTFWLATDPFNGSSPGRLRVSAGGTSMDYTAPLPTGSRCGNGLATTVFLLHFRLEWIDHPPLSKPPQPSWCLAGDRYNQRDRCPRALLLDVDAGRRHGDRAGLLVASAGGVVRRFWRLAGSLPPVLRSVSQSS